MEIAHILKKLLSEEEDVEKVSPNPGWEHLYLDHGIEGLEFESEKIEEVSNWLLLDLDPSWDSAIQNLQFLWFRLSMQLRILADC